MKSILVLNFFPAFTPPKSGGELRYFNLYEKLSKYFDITLLSPTYTDAVIEVIEHSNTYREYRIPKEDIHNEIHWKLEQENFSSEFSALSCAYSGEKLNTYHKYYLKLYKDTDIIVHEFPYMLNYDIFFGIDNKPRIYNSHNLEFDLLSQIYYGENASKHLQYIFNLEQAMVKKFNMVFATSELEKTSISKLYNIDLNKIKIAPNGINPEDYLVRDELFKEKTAFFIGSGHPPNIEAVDFIINELADKSPNITFLIAGSCCNNIKTKKPNVKLLGLVGEKEKDKLFKTSDVAINPMFSGAGTNLKTLEFLSMGIPMISTSTGVRGIELENEIHFIEANSVDFALKLNDLINNKQLKEKLSKNSKQYINERFSWDVITNNIYTEIKKVKTKNKKTIVVLNDFEVSNPFGGGEIRINKLYSEMSTRYNIVLLCLNNTSEMKKTWITDRFLEISIPKTKKHLNEEKKVNAKHWVSANDIVTSYMIRENELFVYAVKAIVPHFDITILNHPYMAEVLEDVNTHYLVHESLNCELFLKNELQAQHPNSKFLIKQIEKVETFSCQKSDLIVSVSDEDHIGLKIYNPSADIVTIKNGVDIVTDKIFEEKFASVKSLFKNHPVVLFIGSAHMPNVESAKYVVEILSQELKHCHFAIIGSVCDALDILNLPSNVLLFGKLDDEYKNVLFSMADIAINPMFGGSGSNLKLAEYFAWKIPTVTTKFGARGYNIHNCEEAIICDISKFPQEIDSLINNSELSKKFALKSFEYVQSNIEWSILGKQYADLLDEKVYDIKKKKLLIVTYRFFLPPLGGAEVYLYELLKGLDTLGDFDITVAYLDAYDIKNLHHFSIEATHSDESLNHSFKNVSFHKFSYDEIDKEEKLKNARLLMLNWLREFRISGKRFIDKYTNNLLLGGWNFSETTDASTQIWSSKSSDLYVADKCKLVFKGFSPSKKHLTFKENNQILHKNKVYGKFTLEIEVMQKGVLTLECTEEYIGDDIRPLGVLIESINVNETELDLSISYREFLKKHYLSLYIDELIRSAENRDKEFDNIFQKTRGLNSTSLEKYLDENISDFDMVLGHSVPFSTTPITQKYAMKHNKPFSLLPHFHFDDEFYHWKSYYEAMQKADYVFASPDMSVELFYNKIGIKTVSVPGGGINSDEYTNIDSNNFLKLYTSDKPFFLVLGRKSGAKNYASVVEAIEKVNNNNHVCNLVVIGRDEDKVIIDSKYTYYLGEQPREVVLGALKECHTLVTMSESESFGIVIVEAWMLNKPVIVNKECPAFVELVEDGVSGLYANKINLYQKLNDLIQDIDIASEFGSNGYKKTEKFAWHDIAYKINNYLKGGIV